MTVAAEVAANAGTIDGDASAELDEDTDEFTFSFKYDQDDVGNTYYYTVSETAGDTKGGKITYDDTVYRVAVTVTENSDNTLTATAHVVDAEGNVIDTEDVNALNLNFENTYEAETGTTVHGTKTMN